MSATNSQPPASPISELRKSFLVSGGAGMGFGIVASVVFIYLGFSPWHPLLFAAVVILATGLFSGLAALGASYLEMSLQRWGIQQAHHRMFISFSVAAASTLALVYTAVTVLGGIDMFAEIQRYSLWGALAGIAFGAAFALYNYRSEVTRQRIALLELENRHLAELASREELLREASRTLSVAEERNRMSRELHDSISQGVHGIVYSLRSLRGVLEGNQRGMEILGHLDETADGTLRELRRLVLELTPSPLEDHGLEEALSLHCDLFARRQKVQMDLNLDYNGELLPDQEVAIYRITQEALANIQKHAGASLIKVSLISKKDETVLTIVDNGRGFDANSPKKGQGLTNIADRTRQSGGKLQIQTGPGQGTTISVEYVRQH